MEAKLWEVEVALATLVAAKRALNIIRYGAMSRVNVGEVFLRFWGL